MTLSPFYYLLTRIAIYVAHVEIVQWVFLSQVGQEKTGQPRAPNSILHPYYFQAPADMSIYSDASDMRKCCF